MPMYEVTLQKSRFATVKVEAINEEDAEDFALQITARGEKHKWSDEKLSTATKEIQ